MRIEGKMTHSGRWWAVEVPALDIYTQARTKKEAHAMVKDAIECIDDYKFEVDVYPGKGNTFEVGSDSPLWLSFILRRLRSAKRLSLSEVAELNNEKSRNTYARYERGVVIPNAAKFTRLIKALDGRLVLRCDKGQDAARR